LIRPRTGWLTCASSRLAPLGRCAPSLAGSVAGTILPFPFFNPERELIVDPSLLKNDELYFNAARLDRSMALKTDDYVSLAEPRIERIAVPLE
jgi:Ala-tRNA(Pro) deacylase